MEEQGELDPLNDIDIFCLHKVFRPRINSALNAFVESWNNHPISTERNLTPNQLFIRGALQQNNSISIQNPHSANSMIVPDPGDVVNVPNVVFHPCYHLRQELQLIDLLSPSNNFGCDIYSLVVGIVGRHLSNGCHNCI